MKFFNFFKGEKAEVQKSDLDREKMPKHVAIVMDGNGRWAKERKLPRSFGHKAGVEAIREVVKESSALGIEYLTLYAFSTENWSRPPEEVNILMNLLVEYLQKELEQLHKNQVVVNTIGDISKLPLVCQKEIKNAYEKTKNNKGLVLNLALNYGGRAEIVRSFKEILKDLDKNKITEENINEALISRYLYTSGMPDPDIVIRPSGEQRLSNFLLWQCAYSEFWYSDVKWPDFTREHLRQAITEYQQRDRRFGAVK